MLHVYLNKYYLNIYLTDVAKAQKYTFKCLKGKCSTSDYLMYVYKNLLAPWGLLFDVGNVI